MSIDDFTFPTHPATCGRCGNQIDTAVCHACAWQAKSVNEELAEAKAENERLRHHMAVIASIAGRDWLIGQLALAESLQGTLGPNLTYVLRQNEAAKVGVSE